VISAPTDFALSLQLFDGFPYLRTRVANALHHIILLPASAAESELMALARWQTQANQLSACLVLASERAIYFEADGHASATRQAPLGGLTVTGSLVPAFDCDDSSESVRTRRDKLAAFVERSRRRGRFVFGDLTKGGHPANADERRRLEGFLSDGTPCGLSRCARCADWKGECLDPSERFAGKVMTVHCCCENHNCCARCGARLFERRLNANYYEPRDRGIWHVPGFCGLRHRCSANRLAATTAS
jgi:hypothetical protein